MKVAAARTVRRTGVAALNRRPWTMAAIVAAGLVIAGCGSSSLSERALRTDATRLCTIGRARTNRIEMPSSPSGTERFLRRGLGVLRPQLAGLRKLDPPKNLAGDYADAITAFSRKVGALSATQASLSGGADPISAFQSLQQQLVPIEAREDDAWSSLDIPACVNH